MATINMHMKFEIEIPKETWLMLRKPCRLQTDGRTDRRTDGRTRWIQYTPPPTSLGGGIDITTNTNYNIRLISGHGTGSWNSSQCGDAWSQGISSYGNDPVLLQYCSHSTKELTHWNTVMSYGFMEPVEYCFRYWLPPLIRVKPLIEPMLTYCQLDIYKQTWVKFASKCNNFLWRKSIWKCHLQNIHHSVHAATC